MSEPIDTIDFLVHFLGSMSDVEAWAEVKRLAELGAAVEGMPEGTSLIHDRCWDASGNDLKVYTWAYEMEDGKTNIEYTPAAALAAAKEPQP